MFTKIGSGANSGKNSLRVCALVFCVLALASLALTGCSGLVESATPSKPADGGATPGITSLSPTSGPIGASVTIAGANFGTTAGTVTFNGMAATATSWSATSIVVTVPTGATTGMVVVTAGGVASPGVSFTVITPAPSITSLNPTSGVLGATVTIAGADFGATQGTSTVKFNGIAGTVTSWSATSIVTKVPAGATTGNVVVTVGGVASNGVSFTVTSPGPSITSLNPASGLVGTTVTIVGANFGATQGTSTVKFNGTAATATSWSATSIVVTVPVGTTTGNVVVTVGGVASNGVGFTVTLPVPSITSLNPTSGLVGATVTITGANFGATQGTSTVKFNGTTATATSWSATSIVVTVPTGATTGNVVVTVGGVASAGVNFTVTVPAPSITSLNPTSGVLGATVTIAGANFGATQGTSTVAFNGIAATATSWSVTSIVTKVPAGATTGNVVVTVGGVASNGVSFTVISPGPSITGLNPTSGLVGATVTITGVNFGATQGTSTVTFNGMAAAPTSWTATSIVVLVPTGATTGNVVVTVGGVASNGVNFTVSAPPPSITNLNPTSGLAGATVTIAGTNFGATQGTSTVKFNGTAATVTSWSATSIVVTVPTGATTGNVVVTVGGVASSGVAFTVIVPAPSISSLNPTSGAVGASITVTGTNFGATQGTSTVKFNGTVAAATSWSATSVAVKVPTGATTGNVVVTVGGVASNGVNFTVQVDTTPPTVPTGLTATAISSSQINLSWTASTDNVGVTGYNVYSSGTLIATTPTTAYSNSGLTASTTYTYTVAAFDAAGNTSAHSSSASATTLATSGGGIPSALGWYQIPNTEMINVCPTGVDCSNVIVAWSGGVADTKRNRLIIWGGGHTDYGGNEVYALDLNTLTINRLNNPSPQANSCVEVLSDGTPPSRHTYDGLSYIASADVMLSVDGSMAPTGCASVDTWTLGMANLNWTNMNPSGSAPLPNGGVAASDYDATSQNVFIHTTSYGQFATYNYGTNSYNLLATFEDINYYVTAVVDSTRRLFFMFGAGGAYKIDISGNDPNYTLQTLNATGCSNFISAQAPGAAYDPVQDRIVGWSGGNTAYIYDEDTDSCTSVTYPNGPAAQQALGTYGRFRYFPALNVFALVNDASQNAWTLRLTTGSGTASGPNISNVGVSGITNSGATIAWTTDVTATSQVEYGLTTAYGTLTTLNSTLVTAHSVALTGLSANTMYHYRVHSKNSSGVETISGDFAFQTTASTDTTPPTVTITAPTAGATVSGTVTVTATATDNVSVNSVQFLLDGAPLGAPVTAAPYSVSWDTTTVTNAAHTLGATATDPSGNVGNAAGVSVTVSNSADAALADFQARCAAPGVLRCEGWDDPADFTPATGDGGYASGLYPAEDGTYQGTQDTTTKISGAGSLKFTIRPGSVHPLGSNPSGLWKANFGPDTNITQFGPHTTLYIQFRLRLDPNMINYDWTQVSGQGWKVFIAFGPVPGSSCTGAQFVQENTNQTNVATAYTSCGTPALDTNNGVPPMLIEQGDYNCPYTSGGPYTTNPDCFAYPVNTWMTEYWVVSIGDFGQPNTSFAAYIAPDGQPLKQFIDLPNFTFDQGSDPGDALMEILLQPYFSGATGATTSPASAMWFDELIISSQPIAAPKF
jgi:hypothetical protein